MNCKDRLRNAGFNVEGQPVYADVGYGKPLIVNTETCKFETPSGMCAVIKDGSMLFEACAPNRDQLVFVHAKPSSGRR